MTDIFEEVVANWFVTKGYFVISNLKVGVKEIDILAIKVEKNGVKEKIHAEVQCSSNPIGYIGGSSSARMRTENDIEKGVEEYINKKFLHSKIKRIVESFFGKQYTKWFICGVLKDEKTLNAFKKNGIEVHRIWDILKEAKANNGCYQTAQGNRYGQLLKLYDHEGSDAGR